MAGDPERQRVEPRSLLAHLDIDIAEWSPSLFKFVQRYRLRFFIDWSVDRSVHDRSPNGYEVPEPRNDRCRAEIQTIRLSRHDVETALGEQREGADFAEELMNFER
jgi:hypothetical protein